MHVFEEGYFRPHWVTLERSGVNAHSLLPKDPQWYLEAGRLIQPLRAPASFSSQTLSRNKHVAKYYSAGIINPLLFPHYRSHIPVKLTVMGLGYLKRFVRKQHHKEQAEAVIDDWITDQVP